MIIKICGIQNKDTLLCLERNRVDFFGMIFYKKSPRNITLNQAKELTNISKEFKIKPVGVFVDHNIFGYSNICLTSTSYLISKLLYIKYFFI